jgi:hypothetical protein
VSLRHVAGAFARFVSLRTAARFFLTWEVSVSDCAFKPGDRVRFSFSGCEARESTVDHVEPLDTRFIVWVVDPDNADEPYPCFERECEVIS